MVTITIVAFLTGALAGATSILSYCLYRKIKYPPRQPLSKNELSALFAPGLKDEVKLGPYEKALILEERVIMKDEVKLGRN